jgi:hypothetical protein
MRIDRPRRAARWAAAGLAGACLLAGCGRRAAPAAPAGAYAELSAMETLSEVARHLYRWHLDEKDFEGLGGEKTLTFLIRPLSPTLDAGDRSLYAEILIPRLSTVVRMKKTDYTIEELSLVVRSDRFKIVNVEKVDRMPADPALAATVEYPVRTMLDYLFAHRAQPDPPSPDFLERLKAAVRQEVGQRVGPRTVDATVHFAPLSPVANEVWAYWEEPKWLLRWASDVEIGNPAVWEHESLALKIFDVVEQTVVAFSEAPGSNAYLTRDQVGRALYNCVVLGRKVTIPPPEEHRP